MNLRSTSSSGCLVPSPLAGLWSRISAEDVKYRNSNWGSDRELLTATLTRARALKECSSKHPVKYA